MNTQFKRGIVELCVLSVLVEEDLYGYAIIQRLAAHIDVSDNTIYPILRRLTKDGYFETRIQESNEGAARKYYCMTQQGFEYYVSLRDTWDAFIGGVYAIITQKGEKDGELFERLARRFTQAKDTDA
ncbi:MAG: PadR family transcriptional regulator [Acholeplasmatales bacterium]|nr:MAG: PadR family transcriptional regulator [Acholeplasmatales bacterium]